MPRGATRQECSSHADRLQAVRNAEHQRRARIVIQATQEMAMQRRIRVAKYLLLELAPLPNGEPWDSAFRRWEETGEV